MKSLVISKSHYESLPSELSNEILNCSSSLKPSDASWQIGGTDYYKFTIVDMTSFIARFKLYTKDEIDQAEASDSVSTSMPRLTVDSSGRELVSIDKSTGDFNTVVTHNICDSSTWVAGPTDSTWSLQPSAGEVMSIAKAECQFIHDLDFTGTKLFMDYYIWHPAFPGTPVLGQRVEFASTLSLFELGNEHYHAPSLPGIASGLTTIIFNYAAKLELYGDETPLKLAYMQISTENHVKPTGTYATVGFVTSTEAV